MPRCCLLPRLPAQVQLPARLEPSWPQLPGRKPPRDRHLSHTPPEVLLLPPDKCSVGDLRK